MLTIKIDGVPSIDSSLDLIARHQKQIPFATSLALNNSAYDIQSMVYKKLLPNKFTLRRDPAKAGPLAFRVTQSNKSNLTAKIGTQWAGWGLQEAGGNKTPNNKVVTVPQKSIQQGAGEGTLVPKKLSIYKLLQNPKKNRVFWIDTEKGPALFQRTGPGPRDIKLLYIGKTSTRVPAKLEFVPTASKMFYEIYQKNFGQALSYALATAK